MAVTYTNRNKCSAFDLKDNTQILLLVGLDSLSRIVENCENIPTFKIQSREIYTIKPHTDFQEICGKTLLRLAGAWSRKKSFMIKMSLKNGELHAETRLSCHIYPAHIDKLIKVLALGWNNWWQRPWEARDCDARVTQKKSGSSRRS